MSGGGGGLKGASSGCQGERVDKEELDGVVSESEREKERTGGEQGERRKTTSALSRTKIGWCAWIG